ncbi:isopeptide-forming domain-containing fimbrial protein [Companilactobacillus huachuanensis]|uniref:Isopeptide-forming domain-containing fimbrial protein n=1 Tax=Companilactobacillus huachuanensis TaxID=2559914 RepID=A0ABW1RLV2_9LACO|nr:isopeptide-forming domain-containing fimbrial protein [Companilactobacillus huachuanensis]
MKIKNNLKLFLIGLFSILLAFICFSTNVSAAISATDFDDGITGWQTGTSNKIGQIDIGTSSSTGKSLKLGYAFGLAQNQSGLVSGMSDDTILTPSLATSTNNIQFSKMNVFLNYGGSYISSAFQSGYKYTSSNTSNVSLTSPNFMLAPSDSTKSITAKDFSILGAGTNTSNNGNPGLTDKKFFYTDPKDGSAPSYKIMGNYVRTAGSANNGAYNLEVELLLRPSPTNSAIVQRELYVKNTGEDTQKFTILFSEDTKLGDSNGGNDAVPIYNLGNGQGLYIQNPYDSDDFKLMVTNQTQDGFKYYSGQTYDSSSMNWAKGFSNSTVTGTGAESGPVNDSLLGTDSSGNPKFGDSSYTLKWNPTTLAAGETAHFGSTIGVTAKPFSIPTPTKTYTNETRTDGTNKVGDKLKFNLKMTNNGYGAQWRYDKLVDQLPAGLQVDSSTLRLTDNSGTTQVLAPSDYDSTTNTITIPPALSLTDDQHATVTFEAQITNDALTSSGGENTITNKAEFTGLDVGNNETEQKTFDASVDIKVEPPDYSYTFTKLIKKHSDTDYTTSVDGKSGDIVDYQILYTVNTTSKDSLQAGAIIDDDLPAGLELDTSSIKIWGPNDSDDAGYNQSHINTGNIQAVGKGQRVKIEFSAKVTASTAGKITNTAYIKNVNTTGNQSFDEQFSTGANLNVQNVNAITSYPTKIDFGSTNMYGKDKTLNNVSTTGELIVAHPDSNPYNVTVSYDNDNPDSQMKNTAGDTLPADASGLLFIRQRNDSDSDPGNWKSITPTGTTIQSSNFTDYNSAVNLTGYVGAGDWQIRLAANTSPGAYNGTLTWGLTESV